MSNLKFNFNFNVSEPIKKNNLSIFFLNSKTQSSETFLTLDEALANNLVEVTEVNNKGTVRYLKVSNKSKKKLLILGSEQIVGNALKQNRVVNNSTLIPGHSSILLSVSCCEKNRWSPAVSNKISISEFLFFPKGRINNYTEIFKNNKTDQFKIWDDISEKLRKDILQHLTDPTDILTLYLQHSKPKKKYTLKVIEKIHPVKELKIVK